MNIAVIVSREDHYSRFMAEIETDDRWPFFMVKEEKDIRGIKLTAVLRVGPYWDNPEHARLYLIAREMIRYYREDV